MYVKQLALRLTRIIIAAAKHNPLLTRKGPSGAASGGGKKFLEFSAGGDEREKSKTNVQ